MNESMESKTINVTRPMRRSAADNNPNQTRNYQPLQYFSLQQPPANSSVDGAIHYPPLQQTMSTGQVSASAPLLHQSQQQQHQQQHTLVAFDASGNAYRKVENKKAESYCLHKVLGCFVCWCCNMLFGFVAWILAMVADRTKDEDNKKARRLGIASLAVSVSGVLITLIIVAIVLGLTFGRHSDDSSYSLVNFRLMSCQFSVNDTCYAARRNVHNSCSTFYEYSFESCCYLSEDVYHEEYCYSKQILTSSGNGTI